MKISIIPADTVVYKDGVAYDGIAMSSVPTNIHALQFDTSTYTGHIEFKRVPNEDVPSDEILTELPSWANSCLAAWDTADYLKKNPVPPTPEAMLKICKNEASQMLSVTDWVENPSVSAVTSTPRLLNLDQFMAYRQALRALAVNPVIYPQWPVKPTAQWSS